MDVFFGWGLKMGDGTAPSVAINANQEMVLAYIPSGHELVYRQGLPQHATVAWGETIGYGDGREPSIAMSRSNVLGVHRGVDDDRLFYELGILTEGNIVWMGTGKYDDGMSPKVAINDSGTIFEVHRSQNTGRIWYNVGRIDGTKIDWNAKKDFTDGADPAISLNNNGQAILTYVRDSAVWYRIATTDGKSIVFQAEHKVEDNASQPGVAVTDEGWFILCYVQSGELKQRVGTIDGSTVSWAGAVTFDEGRNVSVAANNGLAVQVHLSTTTDTLFYSTSIITDRSRWMSDRVVDLGMLPLRQLVLPGSHDAGMYAGGLAGQTQDKNLYQQLTYGMRYFDLRVAAFPITGELYLHHGEVFGVPLTEGLDDIKSFLQKGGKDMIILKFSHFGSTTGGDFTSSQYNEMVKLIDDRLGSWIYRGPLPAGKRLADLTLNDYDGKILIVVDGKWAKEYPHAGYWIYRDATKDGASEGQLRVFDKYSDSDSYDSMKKEQIDHFFQYQGTCKDGSPCDLFLLSWTLTPPDWNPSLETVWSLCHTPNQHLADEVGKLPEVNEWGRIINVVYVDYVQYARPSDVAIAEKNTSGAHG